jgi:hypothetical protein
VEDVRVPGDLALNTDELRVVARIAELIATLATALRTSAKIP